MEELLEIIILLFVFVTSLCFGSFLNVVIYRLPNNMSLVKPNSHCPNCGNPIKWYDNIPILSYLMLRGKCRNCGNKISIRYLIVESITALLATFIYCYYGKRLISIFLILLLFCFIAIFFIDIEHYIIPDSIIICITIIGIIETCIYPNGIYGYDSYKSKLIMIGISALLILSVTLAEKKLNREIIGGGDLKLLASVGTLLGWQFTLFGLAIASIIGSIIELSCRKNLKRKKDDKGSSILPFGPYLVIGFMIAFLFGSQIFNWYFSLFSI